MSDMVIRCEPYRYVHIFDNNTNVTRVVLGPCTYTLAEHEKITLGPQEMVAVPPRHGVLVKNPVVRGADGGPVLDEHGNYKVRFGDEEFRFESPEPFPLYPGEELVGKVASLQVVPADKALRLQARRDFRDEGCECDRKAGDEWLFKGPSTYYPRVEVRVADIVSSRVILPDSALRVRARKQCTDGSGTVRRAGEEWLVRRPGTYLPNVDEEVVSELRAHVLTDREALHLRAVRTFETPDGVMRKAGEEWLVTNREHESYLPDVHEVVVGTKSAITLTNLQWCVVLDPIDPKTRKPQLGRRELRKGVRTFFLHPGERLEDDRIKDVFVLNDQQALLLRAREQFEDHAPGNRWMIHGPCDFVPPVEVEVMERRERIPLDQNEGVYVRDVSTGAVSMITGESYMLKPNEELWEKSLPELVEQLLAAQTGVRPDLRDKTRVVTFRAPHNTAVQVFDYQDRKSRVVWGPDLVMMKPDEALTVLSLSGETPKRPHQIKAIALRLGPDFMTDDVVVETADHARLSLRLSYNWHFDVTPSNPEHEQSIFQVPDHVGDACKAIASRVRNAVAACPFDVFHRSSAKIIRSAVFGQDAKTGKVRDRFLFTQNRLVITNIDIQSLEPVDPRTRDALMQSVQQAIEITTKSQEAQAEHEAARREQEARAKLQAMRIKDQTVAEAIRTELVQLRAACSAVESGGQSKARALARARGAEIEGRAAVEQAELKAKAQAIRADSKLFEQTERQQVELEHQSSLNELETWRSQELAKIESTKFEKLITSVGSDTLEAIAKAGPELQAELLSGLGLKSFLITDAKSPINLFNTASGIIGGGSNQ